MTKRLNPVLAVLGVVSLVAACSNSGATTTPGATPAPTGTSGATATAAATPTATPLKIGVVTDVGTVDDKNFNQYSFEGAKKGAADVGAAEPPAVVPKDASEYGPDIQSFVDQGYNVIVTVGFNLTSDTTKAAKANPNVWFIGVDQAPCVDENGNDDTTFKCKGDPATLLPKYIGIVFKEDQAGYLAGMVAAAASKKHVIGAIGGINSVPAVVRYIQGYELGAKAVDPTVQVKTAYVSTSDFGKAFNDPAGGKTFATQFINSQKVDVLFQVAGKTGNGVLQAACDAGIYGVGVDVDQYKSTPESSKCIITSAEKRLSNAVEQSIKGIKDGSAKGGVATFDAAKDGVGYSPITNITISADVQKKLDDAVAAMKAGTLKTCPDKCGQP